MNKTARERVGKGASTENTRRTRVHKSGNVFSYAAANSAVASEREADFHVIEPPGMNRAVDGGGRGKRGLEASDAGHAAVPRSAIENPEDVSTKR